MKKYCIISIFQMESFDEPKHENESQDTKRLSQFASNQEKEVLNKRPCEFKVVVFHCQNEDEQKQLVENTQFCLAGNKLCYRNRNSNDIKIVNLNSVLQTKISGEKKRLADYQN